jgi:hypothetical protein
MINTRTAIIVFLAMALAAFAISATRERNQPARNALGDMMRTLSLGDSRESARRTVEARMRPELHFDRSHERWWYVRMPWEIRSTDWVLLIEFEQDRLSRLRMRTSDGDGVENKPKESPPDQP